MLASRSVCRPGVRCTYNTVLTVTLGVDRLVVRSQPGQTTGEMTERPHMPNTHRSVWLQLRSSGA